MHNTTYQNTPLQNTPLQNTPLQTIPATCTPVEAPGTGPDLVSYQLVHAAMLRDVQRLADLAERIAAGATDVSRDRAHAVRDYLRQLFSAITHHHEGEDDIVWPVVADRVADSAAMGQLTVDHEQLDPLFDQVLIAAERLTVDPTSRLAGDELAGWLRRLASGLDATLHSRNGSSSRCCASRFRSRSTSSWRSASARTAPSPT